MTELASVATTPKGFKVKGVLDYANAERLLADGIACLEQHDESTVTVDLAGLEAKAGSLAVAVMMSWLKAAVRAEVALCFEGVPGALTTIAEFSGLREALPIESSI